MHVFDVFFLFVVHSLETSSHCDASDFEFLTVLLSERQIQEIFRARKCTIWTLGGGGGMAL